jgi:hypothetical protein
MNIATIILNNHSLLLLLSSQTLDCTIKESPVDVKKCFEPLFPFIFFEVSSLAKRSLI